jgi:hypothetical protein
VQAFRPAKGSAPVFYLLTLPFRLFFGLLFGLIFLPLTILFLPFILLRLVLKTAFALIMLPFALVMAFIGIAFAVLAVSFAILIPLMPFVVIGVCVWLLTRNSRAATVVRG